jgi:Ser/Thr protein kinase RdoA (MazF antagonist)
MMKLSIMRDFLHSPSCKECVKAALSLWNYEEGSEQFIRVSSNFVFKFQRGKDSLILRMTPGEDQNKLKMEMDFLTLISNHGITVNLPVPSLNGDLIETIHTKLGDFQAVVFNCFEGEHLEIEDISNARVSAWGKALGSIHSASSTAAWEETAPYKLENLLKGNEGILPVSALQEQQFLQHWLNELQQSSESYGPLHFDFELDNIIWRGNVPQVIDFESSVAGWYAADIAFALRDLFEHGIDLQDEKFRLFLEGYRQACSITEKEITNIPTFLRLHNLITYKRLLTAVDVEADSESEWVNELIEKLEKKMNQYETEFLSIWTEHSGS